MPDFDNLKGNNISDSTTGLPPESGAMLTSNIEASRPLPCVVILIHGVNDVGEAFENQDKMICEGLNRRLGRKDLKPNKWRWAQTSADDFSPRIQMLPEWQENVDQIKPPLKPKTVKHKSYSPIIPFTWGYRPVDEETYKQEQIAYYKRLQDSNVKDPELPYDSYWIDRNYHLKTENIEVNKLNCDKFGNWIDYLYRRNGGPFANATTCIPDMYGPGMAGFLGSAGELATPKGARSYLNPHRIYYAFAAHRLAKLIKQIRKDTEGQNIPINIVAHSQGTIITMLANLILANDKSEPLPADCVILAHSPYAFEPTLAEIVSKDLCMGVQSQYGREQTFINFVNQMHRFQTDLRSIKFEKEDLIEKGIINTAVDPNELYTQADGTKKQYDRLDKDYELFYRDNFGKVYQYFSPNDHVVSLWNVQGMGWQGIPDNIFKQCKHQNLKQRIFSHGHIVGNDPKNKEVNIPLILIEVQEKDYPSYISVKDYQQRRGAKTYYGINIPVVLLSEQLTKLIQEPLFKGHDGFFSHGCYANEGQSIHVHYIPSNEEIKRDYPELVYQKTSSGQLGSDCIDYEINENSNKNPKLSASDLYGKSVYECNTVTTGGFTTAPYILTTRLINGEPVPETMIYTVDKPSGKTKLSRAIHYNDIYNSNKQFVEDLEKKLNYEIIDRPDYIPEKKIDEKDISSPFITDELQLKKLLDDHPEWDRGIESASYMVKQENKILVIYRNSQKHIESEIGKEVDDKKDTSSHHSGITNSLEAPAKIMAYDLAIGVVENISESHQTLLNNWRVLADWRHPENTDPETFQYVHKGILPDELKKAMNYPNRHMPEDEKLVVNHFYHSMPNRILKPIKEELKKPKYQKLTEPPQWVFPDPDLKGVSDVD
ncbi:T6SS effector phospholipase Tle3 domain-containing protein [Gilliamella apicola]|uniref:T6SS effector phospholipase Tle3 domain-containing protein n=1 Tax=Gilliamella apicola TaxID=1196095 RepID=UPI002FEE5306